MRKLTRILTVCLLLLAVTATLVCSAAAVAEEDYTAFDCKMQKTLSYEDKGGRITTKYENEFDANGNLLKRTCFCLNDSTQVLDVDEVETYTYDANGNLVEYKEESYHWSAKEGKNVGYVSEMRVLTYDDQGRLAEDKTSRAYSPEDTLEYTKKYVHTYEDNRMTALEYYYNEDGEEWVKNYKSVFDYYDNGLLAAESHYGIYGESEHFWQRFEYTYTESGKIATEIRCGQMDAGTQTFVPDYKNEYTYDGQNRMTRSAYSRYDLEKSEWYMSSYEDYTYQEKDARYFDLAFEEDFWEPLDDYYASVSYYSMNDGNPEISSENVYEISDDGLTLSAIYSYTEDDVLVPSYKYDWVYADDTFTDMTEYVYDWSVDDNDWVFSYVSTHHIYEHDASGNITRDEQYWYDDEEEKFKLGDTYNYTYTEESFHHLVKIDEAAATCTEAGCKEYYVCEKCGKCFADAAGTTAIADLAAWKAGNGALAAEHKLSLVAGKAATEEAAGSKDHYECSACRKLFADADGKDEITDLGAWTAEGGDGYIAPLKGANDGGLSTGAIVGIVIGAVVVAGAAGAAVWFFVIKKKKNG